MDFLCLFFNTILLRPYVFLFLAVALFVGQRLIGWRRTGLLFGITWATAFVCEFASTRIGFPFGDYYYTGSTHGRELYLSNIPFMDSLSFTFLIFASYCLALVFYLPCESLGTHSKQDGVLPVITPWSVVLLTSLFFMFIDIVIDPVALRGNRWFLGEIYGYPDPGIYFGVPLANFAGWMVVGLVAMSGYRFMEQCGWAESFSTMKFNPRYLLLGCGLYYGVLFFNLSITLWIGEPLLAMVGCFIYVPITALVIMRWACERSSRQV